MLETSRLVETERIQLQAEMDRRLSESERNYNSALIELETDRYDLMQQLDEKKLINHELKIEILSIRQKLQAREKFIDEQIEERELEREEFRIELNRLKSELETRKSQVISFELMDSADADFCTTPLSMKEARQTNSTPHKMVGLKMEHSCRNDAIKSNVKSFIQSKSWNKLSDSDEDISSGNINEVTIRSKCKCVSQQNDWQPYTVSTMNKISDSYVYIEDESNQCDACTQ
ncbi:unnamed protein product, partial [Schistosoma turkestanicum]